MRSSFRNDNTDFLSALIAEFECLRTVIDSLGRCALSLNHPYHQPQPRPAAADEVQQDSSATTPDTIRSMTTFLNGCAVQAGFLLVQFFIAESAKLHIVDLFIQSLCSVLESCAALSLIEIVGINTEQVNKQHIRGPLGDSECGVCVFIKERMNRRLFQSALEEVMQYIRLLSCLYVTRRRAK